MAVMAKRIICEANIIKKMISEKINPSFNE